jgi:Prokaryotic N-terminal methylation motif
MTKREPLKKRKKLEAGVSLIETMVAILVLAIVSVGILTLASVSLSTTENQGHLGARAADYAQDKMEQLLSLSFNDVSTDTSVASFTPNSNAGSPGLTAGGTLNTGAPVAGYVDYLDKDGNPLGNAAGGGWSYQRVWQVTDVSATMKQISVTAIANTRIGSQGQTPQATLTSLKTSPF